MSATVTGTFLLIDRASGPLRRIEQQAQRTDEAIADLGSRLDNIGTQNQMAQHEKLGRSLRDIEVNADVATGGMESLGETIDETGDVANRATGRMGRFGRMMLLVAGAVAALLPIVIDLAGALGALIGSLGAAIKGVGALGVALGGAIVVGLAGVAGAALAASERMKNLKSEFDDFKETWQGLTRRGQNDFMAMIRDSMADVERLMPMLANSVNRTMPAARDAVDQFFNRLDSPQFERFVLRMTTSFERIAGPIAQTLANVGQTLGNIAVATAPFVEEMVRGIADITRGWAGSTNNIENLRENIKGAVDQAREWWRLLHAIWDVTLAVFGSGADQGQGLVRDMTARLREYEKWINSNPEKMDKFWEDSIAGTKELAKFLGSLRLPLKNLNDAMEPIVRAFERLVGALSRLKLPGTDISGLTAILGAYGVNKLAQGAGLGVGPFGGFGSPVRPAHVIVKNMGGMASPGRGGTVVGGPGGGRIGGARGALGRALALAGRFIGPMIAAAFVSDAALNAQTQNETRQRFSMGPSTTERALSATEAIDPVAYLSKSGDGTLRRFQNLIDPNDEINTPLTAAPLETYLAIAGGSRARNNFLLRQRERGTLPKLPIGSLAQMGEMSRIQNKALNQAITRLNNMFFQTKAGRAEQRSLGQRTQGEMSTRRTLGALDWSDEAKKVKGSSSELKRAFDGIEKNATQLNRRVRDDTSNKWHQTRRSMVKQMKDALPELTRAMQQIRDMTIGELANMGYSRSEARDMMNFANGGGGQGQGDGQPAGGRNKRPKNNALGGRLEGYAGGGRIRGQGKRDTVPLTIGMAAPGELIVNRHTEGRVNSMLGMFGTNLGREVGNETVPHSGTPRPGRGPGRAHVFHARGGRVASYPDAMGALPGLDALAYFLKQKFGLSVSSGLRPGAITSSGYPSDHGWGGAIDVTNGVTTPQMDAAHAWLQANFSGAIKQMLYRTMVGGNHFDHIHVALNESYARNPAAVARLARGGGAPIGGLQMGSAQQINLRTPKTRLRGAPGMAAQGGMNAMTKGMERAINRKLSGGVGMGAGRGATVRGKATWFTGGTMASGLNTDVNPGLALNPNPGGPDPASWNNAQTQGWLKRKQRFLVRLGGKQAVLPVLDMGPAGWTGNAIDVNLAGVRKMGFTTGNFPSGTVGTATALAKGGRVPKFGGWYGNGGKFTTDRPTLIGVGERGKETVEVTPANKGSAGGTKGINISNITINNHREGDIRKQVKRELSQAFNELEREIRNDTKGIV